MDTFMITRLCFARAANYRECGWVRSGQVGGIKHVTHLRVVPQQRTALFLVFSHRRRFQFSQTSVLYNCVLVLPLLLTQPQTFVGLITMTTTLNCFGWMQSQADQNPCTIAQEVGQLCNAQCKRDFGCSSVSMHYLFYTMTLYVRHSVSDQFSRKRLRPERYDG